MTKFRLRSAGVVCALATLMLATGCHRKRKTRSAPKSADFADTLKPIVESKHLQVLHWPNFSDYEPLVKTFYDDRNYEVAWIDDGKPSPQAVAFIKAFQDAANKGLNPEDYNASRWPDLETKLASKSQDDVAAFDAAMTVSVMRYISDLRIGRVNPTHFNFDINTQDKKYDLPEFVSDNAVDAADVPKLIATVEPDSDQYRKLEDALPHYLELAKEEAAIPELAQPLPTVPKPVGAGASYPAADALQSRLQLEGDMPGTPPAVAAMRQAAPKPAPTPAPVAAPAPKQGAAAAVKTSIGNTFGKVAGEVKSVTGGKKSPAAKPADSTAPTAPVAVASTVFTQELSDGVKAFQARHGITPDGKLSAQTIASLNVPLGDRVRQIDDSLERWRWLPNDYVNAPLMVNLPEFVLRGYSTQSDDKHHEDFTMRVVVGKVLGDHDTPVFTHEMKYVIFRPFWNVPISIIKKELAVHISKSGVGYLASHNFETVNNSGEHVDASAAEIERGGVTVREKPGPKNSLGLIKFMFPNEYDIYLHSTPQPELFERTRRDFSHGCVRVQKPADLAVWVLHDHDGQDYDLDKVTEAMQSGQDNHTVNLKKPIPIVIFYLTARVGDDGHVDFFDDLYGYDKKLDDVLAKGMPYPSTPQKVNPKGSPEGTD